MREINRKSKFHLSATVFWLLLTFVLISALSVIRYERFASKRAFGDFRVYHQTGERLLAGESIYRDDADQLTPFKYSPLVASGFAVLAIYPKPWAAGIWHVLNLYFLFGSVFVCIYASQRRSGVRKALLMREIVLAGCLGFLALLPVALNCLNSGQVGIAILFFFLLGVFYAAENDRDSVSAFFFALSAMFKLLPIMVVPYFWFVKRKRWVLFFAFWFISFHLLPAAWLGWERNSTYVMQYFPFLTSTTLDHISLLDYKNQSVWSYLYRLIYLDLGWFAIRKHPQWLMMIGTVFFLVLYNFIVSPSRRKGIPTLMEDCALLSIMIVIFNPNAWKHNFVLLLFPYLIFFLDTIRTRWIWWRVVLLVLVPILFLGSSRSLMGWNLRFDLMSMSILLLASLLLFVSLTISRRQLGDRI